MATSIHTAMNLLRKALRNRDIKLITYYVDALDDWTNSKGESWNVCCNTNIQHQIYSLFRETANTLKSIIK